MTNLTNMGGVLGLSFEGLKNRAPVGYLVLRRVAELIQKLEEDEVDSGLPEAQRGWRQVTSQNMELKFIDPRHLTAEDPRAPPFFTSVQQSTHTYCGMLCVPCGQAAGNNFRERHPAGLTVCIARNEKPRSILQRLLDENLIMLVYLQAGQKLVAPAIDLIVNDVVGIDLRMQSYILKHVYVTLYHFLGVIRSMHKKIALFNLKEIKSQPLEIAAKQFPNGLVSHDRMTQMLLNLLGFNTQTIVMENTLASTVEEIIRILKTDSIERQNQKEVGGLSDQDIAAQRAVHGRPGNSPVVGSAAHILSREQLARISMKPNAQITAQQIQQLLRLGACPNESSFLKAFIQKFTGMTRTMMNAVATYDFVTRQWKEMFPADSYEEALKGQEKLKDVPSFIMRVS